MKKKLSEKRQIFWNNNLNEYEKQVLIRAGFRVPEHFLVMPIVALIYFEGFGYECTIDLLCALIEYLELPGDGFEDFIEEKWAFVKSFQEKEEYDDEFDEELEWLFTLDEMFFVLGYTDVVKKSQITVQELLNIEGISEYIVEDIMYEIFIAYNQTYKIPHHKFTTREDYMQNSKMLFEKLK